LRKQQQRKEEAMKERTKETIKEFLKFRSQFTIREWFEINQAIEARLNQKVPQLRLDDLDIEIISKRLERKK
jgi:hypothetical protein